MIIGKNIKKIRDKYDLTQKELADIAGVSDKAVSTWENGIKEPRMGTIQKIADYFGIQKSNIIEADGLDYLFAPENPCHTYPIIGEVAAGFGAEAIEEETGDYEQIPLEWMRGYSPKDFFVLRVKGNSMYPRYMDGDRVLVLRTRSVDSGAVAVVIYDGDQGTLKKVVYNGNEGYIDLIPYNPEYSPKRIAGEDIRNLLICGEVKRLIRIVK